MTTHNNRIPLFKPSWGDEERKAVADILSNPDAMLNESKMVRKFEERFAEFVGARHCVLVPNGYLALYMALRAKQPEGHPYYSGEKYPVVRVPANYGIFVANALVELGVERVWIGDVARETGTMVGYRGEERFVVHANGRLGNAERWEDCCQAIKHHTKELVSCYSFHSTKIITCGGVGGAVCCDDQSTYEALSALKDHGRPERVQGLPVSDIHSFYGSNYKMGELEAAFGLEQLAKLPKRLERLEKVYQIYQELLGKNVGWLDGTPQWRVDCLVDDPSLLIARLGRLWVEAKRFYTPTYRQPQFQRDSANIHVKAEYLYQHGVYLPSSPDLTDDDIHYVCEAILESL